ncbi:MAG: DUF4854 domain-containing protein [Lachnospiraceae bacterium]|nr:DUF4854 domain-containing protein [Lachnospiraceae bacterium]
MKMRTVKALACAAVMALALSATACGSKEADKAEDNATVENTDSEDQAADNADAEADNADAEAPADTEADNADADAEAPADTEADASADGTALYSTLEEYYNDPAVKSVLDSAFESMGQDGMSLSIEVKGNVFSLTCKFEDSSMVADGVAEALEQGLEAAASQFETQAAAFDEAVGQSGACTVAVRYTDPDDNVLAEREFKAQ